MSGHVKSAAGSHHDVDVVRHDAPRIQVVPLTIEMPQRIRHDPRDLRPPQPAFPGTCVKIGLDLV